MNIDYFPLDKGDIEDNLSWMIGCDYFHSTDQIIQVKENDNADYLFKLISSIIYNTAVRNGPFYEFKNPRTVIVRYNITMLDPNRYA